jgi:hypothetical protein
MHADWEQLSLSGYFEALEAHNEMNKPGGAQPADIPRLRRFVDAHRATD